MASGKQVPKEAQLLPKSKLRSNWDGYEEEEIGSGLEENSGIQVYDVPVPKSKGADYRRLIAEAQSQSQSISDDPCLDRISANSRVGAVAVVCLGSILEYQIAMVLELTRQRKQKTGR
ncbi:hypothetical protein NL676_007490 [Syzygium grande]|nr:hypothetical protein NL676_007490 [Syzygium grande]